jgi:hypothetical protein
MRFEMDCHLFNFADELLDELEIMVNELSYDNKQISDIYAHMVHTQGVMIGSLLRNPSEKKLLQIERIQSLTNRVKRMLPDATAM